MVLLFNKPPANYQQPDVLSEVEVYIAYGRDIEAEEILNAAILKETTRYELHYKLLEIYSNRKDYKNFTALASQVHTKIDVNSPVWQKIVLLGRKSDPTNPLYL